MDLLVKLVFKVYLWLSCKIPLSSSAAVWRPSPFQHLHLLTSYVELIVHHDSAEKATIEYDTSLWSPEKLASEIEVGYRPMRCPPNPRIILIADTHCLLGICQDLGFEATPIETPLDSSTGGIEVVALSVYGMTCASCVLFPSHKGDQSSPRF